MPSIVEGSPLLTLAIAQNQLQGTIPSQISQFQNLELFYAFENQLSGTIPSSLCKNWYSSFGPHSWKIFVYSKFEISPEVGALLKSIWRKTDFFYQWVLYIYTNDWTVLKYHLDDVTSSLIALDVSSNKLTGTIPSTICKSIWIHNL